ncbi:MAG TPA: ubiquitin-conjugating enzyme E2 [Candidatus Angelobacter sp.]
MTSVRQRRLQSDYERLSALVSAQSMLSIESARGNPPETYVIVFRRRSIAELRGSVPVFCGRQRMKIEMPADYPAVPPLVTALAPMFHPHVWPRTNIVCLGPWNITESLDTLVLRLDSLVRYDPAQLNWKSVANQEAADWAVRNQHLFPLDHSEKNLQAASQHGGDRWVETA